jgi:hypothetical protein
MFQNVAVPVTGDWITTTMTLATAKDTMSTTWTNEEKTTTTAQNDEERRIFALICLTVITRERQSRLCLSPRLGLVPTKSYTNVRLLMDIYKDSLSTSKDRWLISEWQIHIPLHECFLKLRCLNMIMFLIALHLILINKLNCPMRNRGVAQQYDAMRNKVKSN